MEIMVGDRPQQPANRNNKNCYRHPMNVAQIICSSNLAIGCNTW